MIEDHGMTPAKLRGYSWLVRVGQTDKSKEDQDVEGVLGEEVRVEKLVDHIYVKQHQQHQPPKLQEQQQHQPPKLQQQQQQKPEPPADNTDYVGIIEEALMGEGNKAQSLEKINAFVQGHPKVDVNTYPKWRESVKRALSLNHRFRLVPVRKAFILDSEEGTSHTTLANSGPPLHFETDLHCRGR